MDVPDKSKDSEFLGDVDPPSRGVKRRLTYDNLNIDIVHPKKCRGTYSANECIGDGDIVQVEEYSQCVNIVRPSGVKRHIVFDDASTYCSNKKTESSYVENDHSVQVTTSISHGKPTNLSIATEGGNDTGDNTQVVTSVSILSGNMDMGTNIHMQDAEQSGVTSVSIHSGNMDMGTNIHMQDAEQSGDRTSQILYNNTLQQPHDTGQSAIELHGAQNCQPHDTEQFPVQLQDAQNCQQGVVSDASSCALDHMFICTCCRIEDPNRRKYVLFSIDKYDQQNDAVTKALRYRFSKPQLREMICRSCHNSLKKLNIPRNAVSSPVKASRCNVPRCVICSAHSGSRMHIFMRRSYGDNPKLDSALQAECVPDGSTICQKCHRKFSGLSMVSCIICSSLTECRYTVLFDPTQLSHGSINVPLVEETCGEKRVCKACHTRATNSVCKCLVCSRHVQKKSAREYCSSHYDFNSFIVSRCIPYNQEDTANKYICTNCHITLASCTDDKPVVPKHVKNPMLRSSANFLVSLSEHPRYACTCCHRLLFAKTVTKFKITDYNMADPIVQACLSHRVALKFEVEKDVAKVISAAKDMVARGLREHIVTGGISQNEFICIRCMTALRSKKPRMPDQACANGLVLYIIPDELANIFPIERRLLSFRIPFITLIVIRRYGGHYKINGPPLNVPATLDQIAKILPRMPGELQLHPLKLKRKLEYKSHYMYDMVRKDKVIGAIMWLKDHNKHYESVPVDTAWLENEVDNDVSVLPCEPDNDSVIETHANIHECSHIGESSRITVATYSEIDRLPQYPHNIVSQDYQQNYPPPFEKDTDISSSQKLSYLLMY